MSSTQDLSLTADQALFPPEKREIEGIVATIYQNERPLSGLAGLLDWRFHGAISQYLRSGAISGKYGECVYLPLTRNGHVYHLLLIGAGMAGKPGERGPLPSESLRSLKKNLISLRLNKIALSKSDFESATTQGTFHQLLGHLKGLSLWTIQ